MRLFLYFFLCLMVPFSVSAQSINIIPLPAEINPGKGNFPLNTSTVIVVKNGVDDNAADFLNEYLKQYFGFKLKKAKAATSNYIQLTTLQTLVPGKEGAYSLKVAPKSIIIQGQTASGTFYGIQTLIQLLPVEKRVSNKAPFAINTVTINDVPRFAYRGMHLDVGRHFFPVSFIKKYIDYLALHKFNTFHWHLTEDQGWRIEIKKYPRLTSVGGWRNGTIIGRYPGTGNDNLKYGGYYTQEQIKEVVAYAQKRYITILPEIELPGHSSAAIAAYPELSCFPNESTQHPKECAWSGDTTGKQVQQTWGVFDDVFCAGKENTFKVLEDVMDEVMDLFPSKMIHVGGDESPKANWKRCPNCQKRMKDNGLKDEHELQSYFIQRMEKYLNSKGRTLIGWDEILEGGLAPKALVMSWRGEEGGIAAAKQNHDVVMTPGGWVYFDHSQSQNEDSVTIGGYTPIEKVYSYEPVPAGLNAEQAKHILGAQANVWSEYMKNTRKVEYMIFPRMSALSEVLWSPKEKRNWNDFEKRLQAQFKRYDFWKVNYSNAYFDLKAVILPAFNYGEVLIWHIESKDSTYYMRVGEGNDECCIADIGAIHGISDRKNFAITKSGDYMAIEQKITSQGYINRSSLKQKFHFNKATGKQISLSYPPSENYPGDGAFTLVNGVQNEKGLAKSKEFVGFNGTNCDALIDMDDSRDISSVTIHAFQQKGSWIWPPISLEVLSSDNGQYFNSLGITKNFIETQSGNGTMSISFKSTSAKFVRVVVKNYGTIAEGNPGAGNKAWLFVDEIEIN